MLRIALIAALLPVAAQALPDQQLRSIEHQLRFTYNIDVDTSQLTDRQAAALYLELNSSNEKFLRTRQKIKTILRRGDAF